MKKKVVGILLCAVMTAVLLIGCGSKEETAASQETAKEAEAEEAEEAESSQKTQEEALAEEEASVEIEEETQTKEEASAGEAKEPAAYVPGTWEGTVYKNEGLGFTVTFPETYTIITGDTLAQAMGQATDTVLEGSDIQNVDMSTVTYDFLAVSPDQVSNLLFSAEINTAGLDSKGYGDALLQSFELMGIPYELFAEPETTMVGDLDFYELDLVLDYSEFTGVENAVGTQTYLIHAEADRIYYFTITFTEDSMEEIAEVIRSIQPL